MARTLQQVPRAGRVISNAQGARPIHAGFAVHKQTALLGGHGICQASQEIIMLHNVVALLILGHKLGIPNTEGPIEILPSTHSGTGTVQHMGDAKALQDLDVHCMVTVSEEQMGHDLGWLRAGSLDVTQVEPQHLLQLLQYGLLLLRQMQVRGSHRTSQSSSLSVCLFCWLGGKARLLETVESSTGVVTFEPDSARYKGWSRRVDVGFVLDQSRHQVSHARCLRRGLVIEADVNPPKK